MYEPKRITTTIILLFVLTTEYYFVLANTNNNREGIFRCMETEREALLKFKEGLIDKHGMISSWGRGNDCCKWEGIGCSHTTGHVTRIELVGNIWSRDSDFPKYYLQGQINSALLKLHNLNDLDLSQNDFGGNKFPEFICSMSQLQHLDLLLSNLVGTVPPCIGNLTNLRELNLAYNKFYGIVPLEIGNLVSLSMLDLSYNSFSGIVPPQMGNPVNLWLLDLSYNSFSGIVPLQMGNFVNLRRLYLSHNNFSAFPLEIGNLTKLQTLDLSSNKFSATILPQLWGLTNLESLYLSSNHFSDIAHPQLWRLTNLKFIDLSRNDLPSSTIDSIFNVGTNHVAPSLTSLNLENNKMKWLPSCIWKFSKLKVLIISFNSLEDTITEAHLTKLPNLRTLYMSFNSLTLDISLDWTPPFKLWDIGLSRCKLGPLFPSWIRTQSNFFTLDLSNNGISGEVPKWFWSLSEQVYYVNISHNQLRGAIPDFSSTKIRIIDVSHNKFSGPIPLPPPSTRIFQISQNMFSGPLSFNCHLNFNHLLILDLSSNQLAGKLPVLCWEKMDHLLHLNLANNSFSGEIPHSIGYMSSLENLHLANNNLSGEFPSTLKKCKRLQLIDIGDNMLTGRIPTWIGEYHESMGYLILRNNRFHGSIPPQICYLSSIQVLDLFGNSISGKIPQCFNNFTHLVDMSLSNKISQLQSGTQTYHSGEFIEYAIILWKRTESEYTRNLNLLKLIDLSSNRLVGSIPRSFCSLKALQSLNLSRNRLTGMIDPDIGQMNSLESLDLSSNQLSGVIPDGIARLNFLSVLDLSNNNLSGKIPIGTQLQTFHASAYAGNIGLCGNPLQSCPGDSPKSIPSISNNKARNVDDGILSLSFLKEFVISIILGFIFGFWGVVGSLIVMESWRRVFYNFWSDVGDWVYVRVIIIWTNLRRSNS